MSTKQRVVFGISIFSLGFLASNITQLGNVVTAQTDQVFELRTYTTHPGRLDALNARFRNHTMRIFEKHGIENVGYWVPQDERDHGDHTLVYIIAHPSRESAADNWKSFIADPEWSKVAEESQRDGRIVARVDSVFMDATDYSQIQ